MMSAAIDRSTSRSLLSSWKELMERLGPLMPGEGKMIYANPHSRRTEIMRLGNDHLIQPDEWAEKHYLDCGPLLDVLRGKKWVLSPRPVEVVGRRAKASIFEVAGGFTITVTFGGKAARARLLPSQPRSRSRPSIGCLPESRASGEAQSNAGPGSACTGGHGF
jgi:hypothetical protein